MQPTQTQPLPPLFAQQSHNATASPLTTPTVPSVSSIDIISSMLGKGTIYGIAGGAILGALVGLPFFIIGAVFGVFIGGAMGLAQGIVNGLLLGVISRVFFYPLTRPTLYRFVLFSISLAIAFFGTLYMFSGMNLSQVNSFTFIVATVAAGYSIFACGRAVEHYISLVGVSAPTPRLRKPLNPYDHTFLKQLFDTMQSSYETVSWLCSFGFSERWRRHFISRLDLRNGMQVGDLMSGAGELWPHLAPQLGHAGSITGVDFSTQMVAQAQIRKAKSITSITVLEQDSLQSSIPTNSLDALVCCYGVKTLAAHEQAAFAQEASRVLRNHGLIGIVEISTPRHAMLRWPYLVYLRFVVPLVGRLFLADPLSYRMLAHYTEKFGNCRELEQILTAHGFEVHYFELFAGCASGVIGMKVTTP